MLSTSLEPPIVKARGYVKNPTDEITLVKSLLSRLKEFWIL